MKTPDQYDLKLGTVVVLNTVSEAMDYGHKMSGLGLELVRVPV